VKRRWTSSRVRFGDGQVVLVSRQLRVFKLGELVLLLVTPRLHRALRLVYDRAGPWLARRLSRRGATLTWLALFPAQLAVELGLRALLRGADALIERTYPRPPAPYSRR
jgi:hypothetical protein